MIRNDLPREPAVGIEPTTAPLVLAGARSRFAISHSAAERNSAVTR